MIVYEVGFVLWDGCDEVNIKCKEEDSWVIDGGVLSLFFGFGDDRENVCNGKEEFCVDKGILKNNVEVIVGLCVDGYL